MILPSENRKTDVAACSSCGKPATTCCKGCKEGLDVNGNQIGKTYYCSLECQKANWNDHKSPCKASTLRKVVYRTGETAQIAFYMYREIFFDKVFSKVEKRGKDLLLFEDKYHGQIYVPLSEEQVPDEMDRKSILSFIACTDAMIIVGMFMASMMKGLRHGRLL